MDNLKAKKRHPEEIAVYTAIYVCAAFSVLLLLGIIIYVFAKGARRVNWAFLTGVTSILHGTVGIAGNILNTLIIILLTMIITTPIGVGAAIYLNEYAKPGKLVTVIIFATETLAGIPSIIFGLFGMLFKLLSEPLCTKINKKYNYKKYNRYTECHLKFTLACA